MFIATYANLIATALHIKPNKNVQAVSKMAMKVEAEPYIPKQIKVQTPEEEKENGSQPEPAGVEDENKLPELESKLMELKGSVQKISFSTTEFEKDDDSNFHIDFINAASNLRATNYQIQNCDRQKTKMIAGKIIPAIATTTAMITGAVTAEIYKFVQGYTELSDMKNSFINLALPIFVFSEPMEATKIISTEYDPITMCKSKTVPGDFTIFDKTVIDKGSITLKELIDHMKETYNVHVNLVSHGKMSFFNEMITSDGSGEKMDLKLEEIYNELADKPLAEEKKYLQLDLGGTCLDEEDTDFLMPPVKYIFKH